jgi:hypothetical protein
MSLQLDKLIGPIVVAAVIALVGIAWRISIQVEGMQSQVSSLKAEIQHNRSVTCRFASKLDIILGDCPP